VKAPTTLDVALYKQAERTLVHLVNLSTNQTADDHECEADAHEVIPLHDIELRLRDSAIKVGQAYRGSDGSPLSTRQEAGWTVVSLPKLEIYEVVVVEP
jgi:hypothetical protein